MWICPLLREEYKLPFRVLRNRSRYWSCKELHHFGRAGTGTGALSRRGSGSGADGSDGSGSKRDVQHGWIKKKRHKLNNFIAFSMHIYYNFRYTESEEKRMSGLMLTFIPFKNVDLLYSIVGQEPEPEPHQNVARSRSSSATLIFTYSIEILVFEDAADPY
jgi:hypothetical protein